MGEVKDSPQETGQTPKQTSYSDAEVSKMLSDEKAKAGRVLAEANKGKAEATALLEQTQSRVAELEMSLEKLTREADERELEVARKDPDALTAYQKSRDLKQQEAAVAKAQREIAAEKAKWAGELEELHKYKVMKQASDIAAKYKGVDSELLATLTDGSLEKMEGLAKVLSGDKKVAKEDEATFLDKPFKPDSGISSGSGEPSIEQLDKMTMDEYARWRAKNP
jgi:predicted RNase H-like nuclease (RuvC/YqgF family)